jgi:phosphoribosylamine--glycine ligase
VGPEVPLAAGIVDAFQSRGLRIFGPTAAATRIESSKAFAKALMHEIGVPTARYVVAANAAEARLHLSHFGDSVVIKADGLAAGKGVVVCDSEDAADRALGAIGAGRPGEPVVLEERLHGPELSVMAFVDGRTVKLMPAARDHKRAFDGDLGPNTGGMGAYSPVEEINTDLMDTIEFSIIQPVVDELARRGTPFTGVLFAGLMLTNSGPQVIEFNARFGDPETQVVMPQLDSDLVDVLDACTRGCLHDVDLEWSGRPTVCVVGASRNYPISGDPAVQIFDTGVDDEHAILFHAGTATAATGATVTAGGRVFAATGVGVSLNAARANAYRRLSSVHFAGMRWRDDIAVFPSPIPPLTSAIDHPRRSAIP